MKRSRRLALRYGEEEFDRDYIKWGFTDRESQIREADSVLRIVAAEKPMRILDLGCGIGTHAIRWAELGHRVTAVDISATFIEKAREAAADSGVDVECIIGSIADLSYEEEFDVATFIEYFPNADEEIQKVLGMLRKNGWALCDVRNPAHPKTMQRTSNWRKWEEREGKYYLERHETDEKTGVRTDEWIVIDPEKACIDEEYLEFPADQSKVSLVYNAEKMNRNGFRNVEFRTLEGDLFEEGTDPYWLWCVARK